MSRQDDAEDSMQSGATEVQGAASRRDFLRAATGRARSASTPTPPEEFATAVAGAIVPPPVSWTDPRLRLLRRATNGLRAPDVAEIRNVGYQAWLDRQLDWRNIDDSALEADVAARWPRLQLAPAAMATENSGNLRNDLQQATLYRAVFSRRQLYERMVEFWSDHFNISIDKVGYFKVLDDRSVIREHALGRFGDLLRASAKSPAMLAYLDQNLSRNGSPNQNYVRELMELHTIGVDGGYTQQDVDELARVFTGWTFSGSAFLFNPQRHDFGAKTVLGVTIPAAPSSTGASAVAEGEQMLTFLINHPSTSRFLATKLLKWFVTPEPTPAQVKIVAQVYRSTGGDIAQMVRTTLNEAWIAASPLKLKRPFHYVASGLRATGASIVNISGMSSQVRTLGQPLFQWETPDGYPDTMEYWAGNITPRWAFGTTLGNSNSAANTTVDVTAYLAGTRAAVVDRIEAEYFGGELTPATRSALLGYINAGTFNATRVRETIALALSTHEFQWH